MRLNYLGSVYPTYYGLPRETLARPPVAVASMAGVIGVPTRRDTPRRNAVIGFFDSLRVEVADAGVSVTLVCPDFVVSEIHSRALGADGRPLGANPMANSKIMTAGTCAALMIGAIERRERMLLTSGRGRLARWMKLIAPERIDRMAAAAIREKR
jgi:short-subunit dehydrogenase